MELILAFIISMYGSLQNAPEGAGFSNGTDTVYQVTHGESGSYLTTVYSSNPSSTSGGSSSNSSSNAGSSTPPPHQPAAATGGSDRGPRRDNGRNSRPTRN